jgi:hypothetical protein
VRRCSEQEFDRSCSAVNRAIYAGSFWASIA